MKARKLESKMQTFVCCLAPSLRSFACCWLVAARQTEIQSWRIGCKPSKMMKRKDLRTRTQPPQPQLLQLGSQKKYITGVHFDASSV